MIVDADGELVVYAIHADGDGFVIVANISSPHTVGQLVNPIRFATIEYARDALPPNLYRLERDADDDPSIVECWL